MNLSNFAIEGIRYAHGDGVVSGTVKLSEMRVLDGIELPLVTGVDIGVAVQLGPGATISEVEAALYVEARKTIREVLAILDIEDETSIRFRHR